METKKLAKLIRRSVVDMTSLGKSSHVGSALSISDLLAVLYGDFLKVDPQNPEWADRDIFILSKGHAGAAVYAALAHTGFFSTDILKLHYQNGSILSGHVSHKGVPGVEFSTGSLGHGLGISVGMAKASKLKNKPNKVVCLLSDGECDEGSNWEAILFAAHHKLNNLIAIVDYNKIQSLGPVAETIGLEPFVDKWKSFGWNVLEVDGHNHQEIKNALMSVSDKLKQPTVIIANTIKGNGISFMENSVLWHYRTPQGEEYINAIKELDKYDA